MALSFISFTELRAMLFVDSSNSSLRPKVQGGFSSRRKDYAQRSLKGIQCSVQQPPPAWPGTAIPEPGRKTWDGPKPISIVGSTGSIGTQTPDIVAENPENFRVVALAAGSNVTLLVDQVKRFKPQLVAVRNESLISELKEALFDCEHKPEIIPGEEGVVEVARHPDVVTVVTWIVGCAGLKVTPATYCFFPQAGVKEMGMEYVVVSSTEKEKETRCGNNEGRAAASIEKENGRKENGTHIEEEATHGMLLLLSYWVDVIILVCFSSCVGLAVILNAGASLACFS